MNLRINDMDPLLNTMLLESQRRIKRRHRKAVLFKYFGAASVYTILVLLSILFVSIFFRAWPIFWHYELAIPSEMVTKNAKDPMTPEDYERLIQLSTPTNMCDCLSLNAWRSLQQQWEDSRRGKEREKQYFWIPLKYSAATLYESGDTSPVRSWLKDQEKQKKLRKSFNWGFFINADSLSPETAGIFSALLGTLYVLGVAFLVAFPAGVVVAFYLEEFTDQRKKFVRFVTININNLAAVPSIIFGLLGLAVFLAYFGMGRSSALVGGLSLGLMMLPIIIVSSRMAIAQVPKTLKEAALGLGASHQQAVFQLVLPAAMPGIITGALLALARMIGESAPLLMVGMVVFLSKAPESLNDPATVLPVQIYQWFQRPEPGFVEASSGAIVVLLLMLLVVNSIAVLLRKKFEKFSG